MKARVEDFMTKKVFTIEASKSILEAAKLLGDEKIGSIVVTHDGKPVGILTDRDILTRAVAVGLRLDKERVERIMSKPLIATRPGRPMFGVMKLMERHSIRRVPVVKGEKIVGIVTQSDVERAAVLVPQLSSGIPEMYLVKNGEKSKYDSQRRQ